MEKQKTVFVVYGRNKHAKIAVFSFLRTLNLEPLEWSQAKRLTHKASPTTIDIVKTGIENAQCVVIIFTGDDLVKLKPEFGSELPTPQPRPNVLFEAGWAFALLGQERTIILSFEECRQVSDLSGITYLQMDNTPEKRRELIESLKLAGLNFDETGIQDIFNPEASGDFTNLSRGEPTEDEQFYLGGFTDYIVDASLNHTPNLLESQEELCSYLSGEGGSLDLKNHYLGSLCSMNWINLSQDPSYGHKRLIKFIEDNVDEIIEKCGFTYDTKVDLVSLGCGDGEIDKDLIFAIQKKASVGCYFPLDYSIELLQEAISMITRTKWLHQCPFKIKAIHGDFTNLSRYKPVYTFEPGRNFFTLVGYTFGNYVENELLGKISEGMEYGDFLLIDARLHEFEDVDPRKISLEEKDKAFINYKHVLNNKFAFGPVANVTIADFNSAKIGNRIDQSITVIPRAINLITYCEDLSTKFRHNNRSLKRREIDLAFTTFYSFEVLLDWFSKRDFEVVWSKKIYSTGLFLLKKT